MEYALTIIFAGIMVLTAAAFIPSQDDIKCSILHNCTPPVTCDGAAACIEVGK